MTLPYFNAFRFSPSNKTIVNCWSACLSASTFSTYPSSYTLVRMIPPQPAPPCEAFFPSTSSVNSPFEHLQYSRHCPRHWGQQSQQQVWASLPKEVTSSMSAGRIHVTWKFLHPCASLTRQTLCLCLYPPLLLVQFLISAHWSPQPRETSPVTLAHDTQWG